MTARGKSNVIIFSFVFAIVVFVTIFANYRGSDVYNIYDKNGILLEKHVKVDIRMYKGFYANFEIDDKEYYITNFYINKRELHMLVEE
jgi:hypothetical protein